MLKVLRKLTPGELSGFKGMVVATRRKNKLIIHNLDSNALVKFDALKGQVSFVFDLRDGEIVVIGEKDGFKEKKEIKDER